MVLIISGLQLGTIKCWQQHLLVVVLLQAKNLHFSSAHDDLQGETALFGIDDIETPLVVVDDFGTSDSACNDGNLLV